MTCVRPRVYEQLMYPSDRQPFRKPAPRAGRRPPPPAGPATIAPAEPVSDRHRRDLLKIAYHRMAKLAGVRVADLVSADPDRLRAIADGCPPGDNRVGKARRLAEKVLRLRR